jgi:hypothetical protein
LLPVQPVADWKHLEMQAAADETPDTLGQEHRDDDGQ